jgi:aldehyde dehydrogenase (NAD+)
MIKEITQKQKEFFAQGKTLDIEWRLKQLHILKNAIKKNEKALLNALKEDLNKPSTEAYASEIGFVYDEINFLTKHLMVWMKPQPVPTPWFYAGAKSHTLYEPYGNILIISPWNYPVLLTMLPLAGAISAGNCAIIKPSEHSVHTSKVLSQIIAAAFEPSYIAAIEGSINETQDILKEKFDLIFFTGSTQVGQTIMQAAAKSLTPTILELGGKNPCVICKDADADLAARKVAWAKFINAGQTCVAPDYVLVHASLKNKFLLSIKKYITQFFSESPMLSPDYCRIINDKHFERLSGLLTQGKVITGGQTDATKRYIAPTVLSDIFSMNSNLMQEEIFGPILPVIDFEDIRRAGTIINTRSKPLAVYLFTGEKETQEYFTKRTSSGAMCINDIMLQSSTPHLPFGGVGGSGMGRYHGKANFTSFSNLKSILQTPNKFDVKFRYPPYKKFTYFILRLLMR